MELGSLPDTSGERLFWIYEYPLWLERLHLKLGTSNPVNQHGSLKLLGSKQAILLNPNVLAKMWDSKGHKLMTSTLPGNHPVYYLEEQGVYCKLYPGLPGINDALHYLYRRLFGATGGLPWSITGLLKLGNKSIPVIISEDAGEKIKDQHLNNLNHYELSKLILFSIITNPEDGKSDNYTVKRNANNTYSVFSVDNDQGLVSGTIDSNFFIFSSNKLSVKSILFCLNLMNQQLHPQAVSEFLALNCVELIKGWLNDLVRLEAEYDTLFASSRTLIAEETATNRKSYPYVLMPSATAIGLAFKLESLKSLLQTGNPITAIALLHKVERPAADYYQRVLDKRELMPLARFDELVKAQSLYGLNSETQTYNTTLTSAQKLFESLVPTNQASSVSPGVALDVFKQIVKDWRLLKDTHTKVLKGNISQLKSLPIKTQQNLMKMIQFNQMDDEKTKSFLNYWAYLKEFTEIHLHHTQNNLLDWHVSYLLKNNKWLTKLSIKNASALTTLEPLTIAKNLTHLSLINLPNIVKIDKDMLHLTDITLKDLKSLEKIYRIQTPKLQRLSISNCPKLGSVYFLSYLDCPNHHMDETYPLSLKLTQIELVDLPNVRYLDTKLLDLTEIYFKNMPNLQSIKLIAPKLQRLHIINCPRLSELMIHSSHSLTDVSIIECSKIELTNFYNTWPVCLGLWQSLPDKYRHHLARQIETVLPHPKTSEVKQLIYGVVETYMTAIYRLMSNLYMQRSARDLFQNILLPLGYDDVFINRATIYIEKRHQIGESFNKRDIIDISTRINPELFTEHDLKNHLYLDEAEHLIIYHESEEQFRAFHSRPERLIAKTNRQEICTKLQAIVNDKPQSSDFIQLRAAKLLHKLYLLDCNLDCIEETLSREVNIDSTISSTLIHYFAYKGDKLRILGRCMTLKLHYRLIKPTATVFALMDACTILKSKKITGTDNILEKLSQHQNKIISNYAQNALSQSPDSLVQACKLFAIEELLQSLTDTENENFYKRANIIDSINQSLVANECVANILAFLLLDQSPKVRQAAAWALACHHENKEGALTEQFSLLVDEIHTANTPVNRPLNGMRVRIENNALPTVNTIPVVTNTSHLTPFLLAAANGDLSSIKKLLLDKKSARETIRQNSNGDSALSLAAKNNHFDVVDYLIRYHYLGQSFNQNERQAMDSLSHINQHKFYVQLVHIFNHSLDYNDIKAVLKKASLTCNINELSTIYLLYFWMHVELHTQIPIEHLEIEDGALLMHHLTAPHQEELVLHMIRQGYVLRNWYINSHELTITNMLIDKPQVDAIESLLQQGQYQLSLKKPNQLVSEGIIYISVETDGLHYTVKDNVRQIKNGVIPTTGQTNALIPPLTLDQLQNVPGLLEQIASVVTLRPTLKQLSMNHNRFTKQYHLRTKENHVYENMIYIESSGNAVKYTVLAPSGKKIIDTFSVAELKQLGWKPQFREDTFIDLISDKDFKLLLKQKVLRNYYIIEKMEIGIVTSLKPIRSALLKVMTQRGHATAETDTMGFTTFMSLLENPLITSNLKGLNLNDCDLFEFFDLAALNIVLPKLTKLTHLNLDNNHIGYDDFKLLLKSLAPLNQLASLSLRFNEIAIKSASEINVLTKWASLTEILITGNHCVAGESAVKLNHKKRVIALQHLFELALSNKADLTVGEFLNTAKIQLQKINNTNVLTMTVGALNDISVALDDKARTSFNDLSIQITECGKQITLPDKTTQGIFTHLISGLELLINNDIAPLVNEPISSTESFCKKLLQYHVDAPIKGLLNRNSFFKTERIESCASYLFPRQQITMKTPETAGQGFVYLIANERTGISFTEHALLGYEYLTSNGQHIFKVAHLQREN
ncbi:MAG: ankyrin repeat domain-containing protein, partial [Legionella sp.]